MSEKDGGSAFPNDGTWANGHPERGMSLRDYFAAQALAALARSYIETAEKRGITDKERSWTAQRAYELADAMIAERAKGSTP